MYETHTIQEIRKISKNSFNEYVSFMTSRLYNEVMGAVYEGEKYVSIYFDKVSRDDNEFSKAELYAIETVKSYFPGIKSELDYTCFFKFCNFTWDEEETN
jgi:hypothetical protein